MIKKPRPLKGRVERFTIISKSLRHNRLGDPSRRDVSVYVPPEYDQDPVRRFPLFMDVVGFMGSGQAHLNWQPFDETVPARLERLVRTRKMGPVIAVFPDCWTRLGGNQYINSAGTGRYADYLLKEIIPEVDRRYRTYPQAGKRAIFGKSSGGYGALLHAMTYASHWGAAACHSGDMYFDFVYGHDIPEVCNALAAYGRDPKRFLAHVYGSNKLSYEDGHVLMFLAMAATYDPAPETPLGFYLPMDLRTGVIDPKRWRRWLHHDPIHLIDRPSVQANLRSLRGLYMDCGTKDQYFLHYGARILHDKLKELKIRHHYEEFADNHSSINYRMDISLPWLYHKLK